MSHKLRSGWFAVCVLEVARLSFGQTVMVRIDGISKDYPGDVAIGKRDSDADKRNVRVSSSSHTYELTCNIANADCTVPAVGTQWRMQMSPKEKPDTLQDTEGEFPLQGFEAYLKSGATTHGPYWLVSVMPVLAAGAYQQMFRECAVKERGITENDCTRWIARRANLLAESCASNTQAACRSLHELLRASDPDLVDVLGRLGQVYVCYHPDEDGFLTLYFADPSEWNWRKSKDMDKDLYKLPPGYLVQIGWLGANFYEKGVQAKNNQVAEAGQWSYLAGDPDMSWNQLTKIAASNAYLTPLGGVGEGPEVDGSLVKVIRSYKNTKDEDVQLTLQIQRSTGRYAETYRKKSTGETFLEYSGECLAPAAIPK